MRAHILAQWVKKKFSLSLSLSLGLSLAAMIEFFVERVQSEKVRNGAGASKIGRGGLCGFSIHPVCQDGGAVGLWMDGSELFSASLPSPFRPRKYASGFRFDLGPELMLTHCKLGVTPEKKNFP